MTSRVCFTVLFLSATLSTNLPPESKVREFSNKYKHSITDREKLLLCIDAIDQGVIYPSGSVKAIDQIFGTDWSNKLPGEGEPHKMEVVYFGRHFGGSEARGIPEWYSGWYLAFEFDHTGTIWKYYLSNVGK